MPWEREDAYHVGEYGFVWFSDGEGAWLVAIWAEKDIPREPGVMDVKQALTVHHISARDNPKRRVQVVREFCQQFMSDIPFRVRVIRNKVTTVRRLVDAGVLPEDVEP
jgi:hypothetical protein